MKQSYDVDTHRIQQFNVIYHSDTVLKSIIIHLYPTELLCNYFARYGNHSTLISRVFL